MPLVPYFVSANIFLKGLERKYLRLCGSSVSRATVQLHNYSMGAALDKLEQMATLCSNKTLFTNHLVGFSWPVHHVHCACSQPMSLQSVTQYKKTDTRTTR